MASATVVDLSNTELYDRWASTYDNDGNVLQQVDDLMLSSILPELVEKMMSFPEGNNFHVLDIGCGTGRNTAKLLSYVRRENSKITGVDVSPAMLAVAREKLVATDHDLKRRTDISSRLIPSWALVEADIFATVPADLVEEVDGVISTLVLEHIPLDIFFSTLYRILRPGGLALVTNIHDDAYKGGWGEVGFKRVEDSESGKHVKFRGSTFKHSVNASRDSAKAAGFVEMEKAVWEYQMTETAAQTMGVRALKWVGVNLWVGMVLMKPFDIRG
ncbi:hypothetical protein HDU93_003366 [Gonapodya sp. JEL0774]|nr:hypothetical protein HDU93_003366 [Gonapodya sp. JEL0774]